LSGTGSLSKVSDKKFNRTLNLQEHPMVWALVEGIRSTLAGDLGTLSRFYRLNLEGNESRWSLVLKPAEPKLRDVLSEIRISGSSNRIDTVEVSEVGGDRSVMTITGARFVIVSPRWVILAWLVSSLFAWGRQPYPVDADLSAFPASLRLHLRSRF
jgi:hypothetical protein